MSDERDEMARELFIADNFNQPREQSIVDWQWFMETPRFTVRIERYKAMAEGVISAGYAKPRQITTVEELDALPVGSVVLHNGRAFQHYPAYPAPFNEYRKWKCTDGGFVRSTKDGSSILPVTVLYEPLP